MIRYDPDFVGDDGKDFSRQLVTVECVECEVRTPYSRTSAHGQSWLTLRHCSMPAAVEREEITDKDWQVNVFGPEIVQWLKERVRNRPYQLKKRDEEYWGISYADIFEYDKSLLERDDLTKPDQPEL